MSDKELFDYAQKLDIPNFNVYSIDELKSFSPDRYENGIINFEERSSGGTHWVCYHINKNDDYNYYFDSFGLPIQDETKKYLNKNGKEIIIQTSSYQHPISAMCGYYCLYVLKKLNEGELFESIVSKFNENNQTQNDKFIKNYFRINF